MKSNNQRGGDLPAGGGKKFLARVADGIGYTLFRHHRGGPIDSSRFRKILLVRLDHIGDLLMTTPAIRALRKAFPAAKIHLLLKSATRQAVELNPYLDRVIIFDAPWTIAGGRKAGPGEIWRIFRELRKEAYDAVIGFRDDPREALLARATGADIRIGYGRRGGGFLLTHLLPGDPGRHEILRALDLLVPLGVNGDDVRMDLFLSPEDREDAAARLGQIGRKPGEKLIGIHPGAASPSKQWRSEGFIRLGDILARKGCRIILLGGPGDRTLLQTIVGGMETAPAVIHPAGVRSLGALVEKLDGLVCNDSAPSHIAQAVGTRAVVLFGPTHDAVTGPRDRGKHAAIRHPVPCSPCWLPGGIFECRHDFRCWKELSPEEVAAAVDIPGSQDSTGTHFIPSRPARDSQIVESNFL